MTQEELYAHPGWRWCSSEGAELHTMHSFGFFSTRQSEISGSEK